MCKKGPEKFEIRYLGTQFLVHFLLSSNGKCTYLISVSKDFFIQNTGTGTTYSKEIFVHLLEGSKNGTFCEVKGQKCQQLLKISKNIFFKTDLRFALPFFLTVPSRYLTCVDILLFPIDIGNGKRILGKENVTSLEDDLYLCSRQGPHQRADGGSQGQNSCKYYMYTQ
jgi:hypothetical protein